MDFKAVQVYFLTASFLLTMMNGIEIFLSNIRSCWYMAFTVYSPAFKHLFLARSSLSPDSQIRIPNPEIHQGNGMAEIFARESLAGIIFRLSGRGIAVLR